MTENRGAISPILVACYRRTAFGSAVLQNRHTMREHAVAESADVLNALERVLLRCDGYTSIGDLISGLNEALQQPVDRAISAFLKLGVLVDSRSCPNYAASLLTQAMPAVLKTVERAYQMPRWKDGRFPHSTHAFPVARQAPRRARSATIDDLLAAYEHCETVTPAVSRIAELLSSVYGMDHGHKVVPSAGAMWPLALHAVIPATGGSSSSLSWFDDTIETLNSAPGETIDREALRQCFFDAEFADRALVMGAAVVVISADLRRVGLKYGTRAMHYALVETGAAMQRCYEQAGATGLDVRAIGGFWPSHLQRLLGLQVLTPTMTILVSEQAPS